MQPDPKQWFENEQLRIEVDCVQTRLKIKRISLVRLLLFIAIFIEIVLIIQQFYLIGNVFLFFSLIAFILAVKKSTDYKKKLFQLETGLNIIQQELSALRGNPSGIDLGSEFLDLKHPFAHDLDLFGKHSLWHYLNRTLTFDGRKLLADALLVPALNKDEITHNQLIVSELISKPDVALNFRVHGLSEQEKPAPASEIKQWILEGNSISKKTIVNYGRWIFPAITCLTIVCYILNILPASFLSMSIALNFIILGTTLKRVNYIHQKHSGIVRTIAHHRALLAYVSTLKFEYFKLTEIQSEASTTILAIKDLDKALNRFDVRLNGFMGIVMNVLFMFDYHCLVEIEAWKKKHVHLLEKSLENMALMEFYVSLANFSFQRSQFNFPRFTSEKFIHADGLFHPLISAQKAVSNKLILGKTEKMVLLTGANMTGKSTWLRTIGLNLTLAYLGLPVAAKSATFPLLRVYTSMRITDDLEEGISYFKAEISRLQALLCSIRNNETLWLYLIDEPLRGTNSGDKQAGTIGIIKNLIQLNTIGILASHDASLSVLESENPGLICNMHFDSQINGNELTFDYTLKSGCSTSNNATLLMRLNGILID